MNLRSLVARHHQSYNDRDLDGLREVFDQDVEIVVDGSTLHGVHEAVGYVSAIFREFPRLRIDDTRIVAESADTIVAEHRLLNGDPSGGPLRRQGSGPRPPAPHRRSPRWRTWSGVSSGSSSTPRLPTPPTGWS